MAHMSRRSAWGQRGRGMGQRGPVKEVAGV